MKTPLMTAALLLFAASPALPQSDSTLSPVQQLLDRQIAALKSGDLEALLRDYHDEAVLLTTHQTRRGNEEIRSYHDLFLRRHGLSGSEIQVVERAIEGELALITWTAKNELFELSNGTDTYLVRDGKIAMHTRAFGLRTLPASLYGEIPAGWQRGTLFPFPLTFAPQIDLEGYEELFFAPGWADPAHEGTVTYSFIWWVKGSPRLDIARIEQDMLAYFQGLSADWRNGVDTTTFAARLQTDLGTDSWGEQRYTGTITWFVPWLERLVDTNVKVVTWRCESVHRTGILFKMSSQPFESRIWQTVDQLRPVECK